MSSVAHTTEDVHTQNITTHKHGGRLGEKKSSAALDTNGHYEFLESCFCVCVCVSVVRDSMRGHLRPVLTTSDSMVMSFPPVWSQTDCPSEDPQCEL